MKGVVFYLLLLFLLLPGADFLRAQAGVDLYLPEVDVASFTLPDSPALKDAGAVYIADLGRSDFTTHTTGKFSIEFRRHIRIRINNSSGFDASQFEVPLYSNNGNAEKLVELKAFTYNLVNGIVVPARLEEDQVFLDKKNKRWSLKKFAMPAVKQGSIIDVQYAVSSVFVSDISTWYFQGKYPRMRSEYSVLIPVTFSFNIARETKYPFSRDTSSLIPYSATDIENMGYTMDRSAYTLYHWSMNQVPGLKLEPFTLALENHLAKIAFHRTPYFNLEDPSYRNIWPRITKSLLESDYFGAPLYAKNSWLNDEIKTVVGGSTTALEKARKIYAFVRDNIKCTDGYELFLTDKELHKVLKDKKGSAADINLLLIAMLYHEKIEASPVIIRTQELGRKNDLFPAIEDYNLTIAVCLIDGKVIYLDASNPMLGFGKLNSNCYNGHARIIRGASLPVYFETDSLEEKTNSHAVFNMNADGDWRGHYTLTIGNNTSERFRKLLEKNDEKDILKELQAGHSTSEISKLKFENPADKDDQLKLTYEVTIKKDDRSDAVYVDPLIGSHYKNNPFKSSERLYAVEMPYLVDEDFIAEILVPDGYVVDEAPETLQELLNGGDGLFEYFVKIEGDKLIVSSRIVLHKATFPAKDYQSLREFYSDILKKHSEQIVFKKRVAMP